MDRREFLLGTTVTALTLALPGYAAQATEIMGGRPDMIMASKSWLRVYNQVIDAS